VTTVARLYEHAENLGQPLPAATVTALDDEAAITAQLVADGQQVSAELAAAVARSQEARDANGETDWSRS
jgi:hypothetical protein